MHRTNKEIMKGLKLTYPFNLIDYEWQSLLQMLVQRECFYRIMMRGVK